MTGERLSYPDFRQELLFAFAVYVEGDFDRRVYPTDVAKLISRKFQPSWIKTGAASLCESEFLLLRSSASGDSNSVFDNDVTVFEHLRRIGQDNKPERELYSLTEKGYFEAAKFGRIQGRVLESEMDEFLAEGGPEGLLVDSPSDSSVIVKIDRASDDFLKLEESVDNALHKLSGNNALMSDPDGSRRQAELKAAKALLLADKMNVSLFKKIVIPALQWLAAKVGDEASGMAIQAAIALVITWIAANGG
ncbi:hypothetical protein [Ciceribacter selenitireducens]